VDAAERTLELRLAALFADLPRSKPDDTRAVQDLVTRLRFSNAERKRVSEVLAHYPVDYSGGWSDIDLRRWLRRVGPDVYSDLCRLERANLEASPEPKPAALKSLAELEARAAAALASNPPLALGQLALNGRTLMTSLGVKPGPHLGVILERLLTLVVDEPELNREDVLLERARGMLGDLGPA
jgi:tRNA nucleotidyltransferase (CCA-adding enzyme)